MQFSGKKTVQVTFEFDNKEVMALKTLGETSHNYLVSAGMSNECASLLHAMYWKIAALLEDQPT